MKVFYIVCSGRGGSNISLYHSLELLKNKNVEAYILAPDKGTKDFFSSVGKYSFSEHYFPCIWPSANGFVNLCLFVPRLITHLVTNHMAARKINNIIKSVQPDIIHTNVTVYEIGFRLAQRLGIPHVWHIREYITEDFGYHPFPLFSSYTKKLDSSYSISISNGLVKHFNLHSHYRIIYNGILNENECKYFEEKEPYVLYVGALTEGKGIASLIVGYLEFVKKTGTEVRLFVAGNGTETYKTFLRQLVDSNSTSTKEKSSIVFLGQRNDISDLMAKALCLVVPSVSEAFGRITAEAMFNRCLVIGKNCAGTKEQLDNGLKLTGREIGLRYDKQDELIACLEIATSRQDFNQMKEDAFQTVKQLYTPEANASNIYEYYKQIIEDYHE